MTLRTPGLECSTSRSPAFETTSLEFRDPHPERGPGHYIAGIAFPRGFTDSMTSGAAPRAPSIRRRVTLPNRNLPGATTSNLLVGKVLANHYRAVWTSPWDGRARAVSPVHLSASRFRRRFAMPARRRLLGGGSPVTTAACLGSQSLSVTAAMAANEVVSRGVTIPAFYTPPATLPAANGAVVRTEPLPLALSLPGINGPLARPGDPPHVQVHRLHRSPGRRHRRLHRTRRAWWGGGPRPWSRSRPGRWGRATSAPRRWALQYR